MGNRYAPASSSGLLSRSLEKQGLAHLVLRVGELLHLDHSVSRWRSCSDAGSRSPIDARVARRPTKTNLGGATLHPGAQQSWGCKATACVCVRRELTSAREPRSGTRPAIRCKRPCSTVLVWRPQHKQGSSPCRRRLLLPQACRARGPRRVRSVLCIQARRGAAGKRASLKERASSLSACGLGTGVVLGCVQPPARRWARRTQSCHRGACASRGCVRSQWHRMRSRSGCLTNSACCMTGSR